jgi:hypothetical protein
MLKIEIKGQNHLHLPLQVFLFGPLHMVSSFPFEGFFKVCHQLFNGTRAIAEQISRNLSILDHLSFIKNFTKFKLSNNEQIQNLQQKINYAKQTSTQRDYLVNSYLLNINSLNIVEQELIKSVIQGKNINIIESSLCLYMNKTSKNFIFNTPFILKIFITVHIYILEFESYLTSKNSLSATNHALCYEDNLRNIKFAFIKRFVKIGNETYSIIRKVQKKRAISSQRIQDLELNEIIDKFFLIGNLSSEFEIIKINQIVNKSCILVNDDCNEIFFSR